MKACKLLKKGCIGYWCYAPKVEEEEVKIEEIPMMCDGDHS